MNLQEVITLLQLREGAQLVSVRFEDGSVPAPDNVSWGSTAVDARAPLPRGYQPPVPNMPYQDYTYKCLSVPAPTVGDLVIVESGRGYKIGRVIALLPTNQMGNIPYDKLKHVVARLDLSTHERTLAAEAKVKERLAMAEITERLASVQKLVPNTGIEALASEFRGILPGPVTVDAETGETEEGA